MWSHKLIEQHKPADRRGVTIVSLSDKKRSVNFRGWKSSHVHMLDLNTKTIACHYKLAQDKTYRISPTYSLVSETSRLMWKLTEKNASISPHPAVLLFVLDLTTYS